MAGLALGPISSFVAFFLVNLFVAAMAIQWSVLVTVLRMAFFALNFFVFPAGEVKSRLFMVVGELFPLKFTVTFLALIPQFALVALGHVVLAMTGNTFLAGVAKLDFGGVATFTFHVNGFVAPFELVAGTVMIKLFLVDD